MANLKEARIAIWAPTTPTHPSTVMRPVAPQCWQFLCIRPQCRQASYVNKQSPPVQSWADASNFVNFRPLRHKAAVKLRVADSDRRVRRELTCVCFANLIFKHLPADSVCPDSYPTQSQGPKKVEQRTKLSTHGNYPIISVMAAPWSSPALSPLFPWRR